MRRSGSTSRTASRPARQYLAINPKGRVPALVTDRGILTETPAILAFIAQSFPQAKLVPDDPFAFAQAQSFNSYLCSTVHINACAQDARLSLGEPRKPRLPT